MNSNTAKAQGLEPDKIEEHSSSNRTDRTDVSWAHETREHVYLVLENPEEWNYSFNRKDPNIWWILDSLNSAHIDSNWISQAALPRYIREYNSKTRSNFNIDDVLDAHDGKYPNIDRESLNLAFEFFLEDFAFLVQYRWTETKIKMSDIIYGRDTSPLARALKTFIEKVLQIDSAPPEKTVKATPEADEDLTGEYEILVFNTTDLDSFLSQLKSELQKWNVEQYQYSLKKLI